MHPAAALALAALTLAACSRGRSEAVLREPDTASRLHVADTAAAAGQTDIALSMYAAAAQSAPDDIDVQARYISLLIRAEKPEQAEQALAQAMRRKPNDPTLRRWLGILRLENGAAAEALQIFDALLARKPRDVAALNGRGMALDLANQHDVAQLAYRAALAESPSDTRTANNLAVSLLLAGRPAEARAILLPLTQQPDTPNRVLNNLAIAQAVAGDRAGSNARLAGHAGASDIRALATALGAAPALDDGADAKPVSTGLQPAG